MKAAFRLYMKLISASIRARMQYKFDFIASSLIQAVMGAYDFLLVAAILWKFKAVSGWNIYEVGVLFSVSRVAYGIYRVFCNELDMFEPYIVRGDFDSILIRPWPTLYTLLSRNFDLSRVAWIIQGGAVGAISVPHLVKTGVLSHSDLIHLGASVVWSALLYIAVSLATASAAFWIVRIEELSILTVNASSTATLYPLDIYPSWLKRIFLSVIPLGVGNYIPAVYLLDKGGTWMNLVWPAIAAPVSVYLAMKIWHLGEARYHSTGS
ncbi:MAG: ABC-2 family transporter protein [Bacillota bacterium]